MPETSSLFLSFSGLFVVGLPGDPDDHARLCLSDAESQASPRLLMLDLHFSQMLGVCVL